MNDPQPAMMPQNQDPSEVEFLISYKNKNVLIGYCLGFLSLLPLIGAIFFIPAYIFSILGLLAVNKNPAIKGKIHAIVGVVLATLQLIGLLLLVLGIISNK
jgi:hypothetical protein